VRDRETRDRRIQKTEALLRGALAGLVHEKPYEEIVVKEILARANVGRSTFYTHFRDKDDLLLDCIREILRSARPSGTGRARLHPIDRLVWFSRPILEHIESQRRAGHALMGPEGRRAMHERIRQALAQLIEDEVGTALRQAGGAPRHASPDLLARWIASSFVLVLNWWVESGTPLPAHEADSLFRGLVVPALAPRPDSADCR
jgi:AcrR family transcriptional regulator